MFDGYDLKPNLCEFALLSRTIIFITPKKGA